VSDNPSKALPVPSLPSPAPFWLRTPPPPSPVANGFGKPEYLALKQSLSVRPRALISVAVLFEVIALGALAVWLSTGRWPAYLLSQFVLATAFFQAFALLHECAHGNAARATWLNVCLGHLASVACFLPFYPWRYIHQQHHAWTGTLAHDPSLAALRDWRRTGAVPPLVRASWRGWVPLAAFIQHVVFWTYPLKLIRCSGDRSQLRRQLIRCAGSVAFIAATYVVAFAAVRSYSAHAAHTDHATHLSIWTFGPALLLYLVACELVNLPHHVGAPLFEQRLPPWEQWRTTRSCLYPRGVSEFFLLNFNFHIEHHVFPFLPWYRLRAARVTLRKALGPDYQQEVGIDWNLRHRTASMNDVVFAEPARKSVGRGFRPAAAGCENASADRVH
jgi:omega-6 fatty acid desaturase (delta-12 desaturase)